MRFIILCVCLVMVCEARKLPPSAIALKYKNLNYFENDEDLKLRDDENDDQTPVIYSGDNMKAKVFNQENLNQGKGRFKYTVETENGISVQQAGKLKDNKTFVVQGSYSYTGADGRKYRVKYTADEFGYHPITELDIDIPDLDTNQVQSQSPKVTPYKKFNDRTAVPPPPSRPSPPPPPKPTIPVILSRGGFEDDNPFGNPGPYAGNLYLPPSTNPPTYLPPHNDYLPPSSSAFRYT